LLFTIGSNSLTPLFVPETMGILFGFLAIYLLINNRIEYALISSVLAAYSHLHFGIFFSAMTIIYSLIFTKQNESLKRFLYLFLLLSPLACYYLINLDLLVYPADSSRLQWLLTTVRNPHHLLILQNPNSLILYLLLSLTGIFLYLKKRDRKSHLVIAYFLSFNLLATVTGIVFTELFPILTISRLHLMRFSLFTAVLSFLYVFNQLFKKIPQLKLVLITSLILLYSIHSIMEHETIDLDTKIDTDWKELALWFETNTAPGSIVLSPPYKQNFRWISKRPIVANFKCFPFFDHSTTEWSLRIATLSNVDSIEDLGCSGTECNIAMRDGFLSLTRDQIVELARKYNTSYVISERKYNLPLIHNKSTYYVYDLENGR
jgi:hypothetical protein